MMLARMVDANEARFKAGADARFVKPRTFRSVDGSTITNLAAAFKFQELEEIKRTNLLMVDEFDTSDPKRHAGELNDLVKFRDDHLLPTIYISNVEKSHSEPIENRFSSAVIIALPRKFWWEKENVNDVSE